MRKLKKLLSIAMSVGMIVASAVVTMPANTVSATSITFKQGDANGDGAVSVVDLTLITKYLNGNIHATAQQITRMDAVQNKVIEMQDYNKVLDVNFGLATAQTVTSETYTNINNEARIYYKHDCSSSSWSSYESYELELSEDDIISSYPMTRSMPTDSGYYQDSENLSVVQLAFDDRTGSGFIVDDHIIATAAHNVYNIQQSKFNEITVHVLDANGYPDVSYTSDFLHVPEEYINPTIGSRDNYDYALIYTSEKLTDDEHSAFSLGCITNEFMATNSLVATSGFTGLPGYPFNRYYSSGAIDNTDSNYTQDNSNNNINLRLHTAAAANIGESGGPMYIETTYKGETVKSAIGIVTGGCTEDGSWGTKFTPTLARFYLSNPELPEDEDTE